MKSGQLASISVKKANQNTDRSEALEQSADTILGNELPGTVEEIRVGALWCSLEVRLDDIRWNSNGPHCAQKKGRRRSAQPESGTRLLCVVHRDNSLAMPADPPARRTFLRLRFCGSLPEGVSSRLIDSYETK